MDGSADTVVLLFLLFTDILAWFALVRA